MCRARRVQGEGPQADQLEDLRVVAVGDMDGDSVALHGCIAAVSGRGDVRAGGPSRVGTYEPNVLVVSQVADVELLRTAARGFLRHIQCSGFAGESQAAIDDDSGEEPQRSHDADNERRHLTPVISLGEPGSDTRQMSSEALFHGVPLKESTAETAVPTRGTWPGMPV